MEKKEEKQIVYVILKDSSIYGIYDQKKWDEFNSHAKEKYIFSRFTIYKGEINGPCEKIYWNRYTDIWEKDK